MQQRKLLRMITALISILVIAILSVSAIFLIYRNISADNKQMEVMQKDMLFGFRSKVEENVEMATKVISKWMLDEKIMQFATEDEINYGNLTRISKESVGDLLYQNMDCVFGVFRPDRDIFITNVGLLHAGRMERVCSLTEEADKYIQELPQKEFMNNYCIADEITADGKRLNLFIRRSLSDAASTEFYGFVSLNLQQVAEQTSQLEDRAFFVFQKNKCFFISRPEFSVARLNMMYEPSKIIYNLRFASGVKGRRNIGIWFLYGLLFVILAAAGLYVSVRMAKRLHRPIENILQDVSEDDGANIYDEEAYIRNRVKEIKTVNREMEQRIRQQDRYLRQNFVRDLLYGIAGESVSEKRTEEYHLNELCGEIALAILNETEGESRAVMLFNEIAEALEAKFEKAEIVFLNAEQIAVIARGVSEQAFKEALTQVILQISESNGVSYTAAVGVAKIRDLSELSALFNQVMSRFGNGYFGYDRLIITDQNQMENKEEYSYYYPMDIEKNIIACLLNGDYERGMHFLENILRKNLEEMNLTKEALVGLKFSLVATIKRVLQSLNKTEEELFGEGTVLYLELGVCKTPEEIKAKVQEMFSAICQYREMAFDVAGHVLMDSMESYVRENYQRPDMSLTLLAEHFNLTTSYIGKLFKKSRQVNFKDYLTAYRIDKATEILEREPQIRIADLANMVGYDHVNSFNRNFKKRKQVSPSEYKRNP